MTDAPRPARRQARRAGQVRRTGQVGRAGQVGGAGQVGRAGSARSDRGSTGARFISGQAYLHAVRAELSRRSGDLARAEREFQLALVHDPDSHHLALEFAEMAATLGRIRTASSLVERTLSTNPALARAWRLKGKFALRAGRLDLAERALHRATVLAPESSNIAIELARVHEARGDVDEAVRWLWAFTSRMPGADAPLREIARLERSRHRLLSAAKALERAMENDPQHLETRIALFDLYDRLEWDEVAALLWREYTDAYPSRIDGLLAAARAAFWVGDEDTGRTYVRRVREVDERRDVDESIGKMFFIVGHYDEAADLLSSVSRERPNDTELTFTLALAYWHLGRDDDALAALAQIGPQHRRFADAQLESARITLHEGRMHEARALLERAHAQEPADARIVKTLAIVLERLGDGRAASSLVSRALERAPEDPNLMEARTLLLLRQVDRDAAVAFLDDLTTRDDGRSDVSMTATARATPAEAEARPPSDSTATARRALARALELEHESEAALLLWRSLHEADPDDCEALTAIGRAWARAGEHKEESISILRHAHKLCPASPDGLAALGSAYLESGRLAQAHALLSRAVRLAPRDARIAEDYGDLLGAMREHGAAQRAYATALEAVDREVTSGSTAARRDRDRLRKKLAELGR